MNRRAASVRATGAQLASPAIAAGLYLPSSDPGHVGHELKRKIRRAELSCEHDLEFAELLAAAARRELPGFEPDLVVSVPGQSGERDRFEHVRALVASRLGAADAGSVLRQTRVVAGYRQMTRAHRLAACASRFAATDSLRGRRVLLIDDVITSGAQACEAGRALIAAGATDWRLAALAQATAAPGDVRTVRERRADSRR